MAMSPGSSSKTKKTTFNPKAVTNKPTPKAPMMKAGGKMPMKMGKKGC